MSANVGVYLDHDTNLDASALLLEFDKGLRSNRAGEQCEAIVRFPWLFERYPFPILINTAALKLAEVFRTGSNFSRLLMLKVFQQSEKHLDKILNIDEFVRRLFSVTHSNDPLARSITLRTLGAIAGIVIDRKSVHHCIRDSLDSHDEVEAMAAIEAAAALAKKSVEFAMNVYPKVLKMIGQLATPLEAKIRLLTVLHHSHYNVSVAAEVRRECVQLLQIYPSEAFVCAILHTLSFVASTSLTQVPEQVDLLLTFFIHDNRPNVKRSVLQELMLLAETLPHLWTKENITVLTQFIEQSNNTLKDETSMQRIPPLLPKVMAVLAELVKCSCLLSGEDVVLGNFFQEVVRFCLAIVYGHGQHINFSATCFQLLTSLSMTGKEHSINIREETVCALQAYILSTTFEPNKTLSESDKRGIVGVCKCAFTLCKHKDVAPTLTSALRFALVAPNMGTFWVNRICETLSATAYRDDSEDFKEDIIALIERLRTEKNNPDSEETMTRAFTLLFQTLNGSKEACTLDVGKYLQDKSHWCCYKVVRQAMHYGHHETTISLCKRIAERSSSEAIYFWMISLAQICSAESQLTGSTRLTESSLSRAISLYVEAASSLKAAVTQTNGLIFQSEYVNLRLKLLQAHALVRDSCRLVRTAPAPAIAASTAQATRDDLLKFGSVVVQMRKCAREFRGLSDWYSGLFQSSFNADNQTLAHLQLLQNSCTILAEAIESLFQTNRVSALLFSSSTHLEQSRFDSQPACEHERLIAACRRISDRVRTELANHCPNQIDCAHIDMLHSISEELLSVPLCMPRFFFQSVQTTGIKLNLSPQPKSAVDLIMVKTHESFALKVEGVVVMGQRKKQVRNVAKVMLSVASVVTKSSEASAMQNTLSKPTDGTISLSTLVVPHNDYFQTQFLLPLTVPGLHTISVEASTIDDHEAQWKTGPVLSTSVKVIEDVMR